MRHPVQAIEQSAQRSRVRGSATPQTRNHPRTARRGRASMARSDPSRSPGTGLGRPSRRMSQEGAECERTLCTPSRVRTGRPELSIFYRAWRRTRPLRVPTPVLVLSSQAREGRARLDGAREPRSGHGTLSLAEPAACSGGGPFDSRPFQARGSSKEATGSRFGRPATPLRLFWRSCLVERLPSSSSARSSADSLHLQSPELRAYLRLRPRSLSLPSTCRSSVGTPRTLAPDADQVPGGREGARREAGPHRASRR